MRILICHILCALAVFAMAAAARAEVDRIEILERAVLAEGRSFGGVGPYERLRGRLYFTLDTAAAENQAITDIKFAPKDSLGRVSFAADFMILRPVDGGRANGRVLFEASGSAGPAMLTVFNDATNAILPRSTADAGNGFLMEQGYTVVWSAWQGDAPAGGDRMLLTLPVAAGITGTSREEFIFENATNPATAALTYPADDMDTAKAKLTVRAQEGDARQTPAGLSFAYLSATEIRIERPAGFDAGAIYEFIYPARDPRPMGLGFAATRDIVSFLRREANDGADTAASMAETVLANGTSAIARRSAALGKGCSG